MENYSHEKFDSINSELQDVSEKIVSLTQKQEDLMSERELLLRDAENEARIIDVLYDIEGGDPFVDGRKTVEDCLSAYLIEAKLRISSYDPNIREYKEREIGSRFDEAVTIFNREDLNTEDYDKFREAVKKLRVGFYAEPSWGETLRENIPVTVKSMEVSEPGFSGHGFWYGYRFNLTVEDEDNKRISLRVDDILKEELGIQKLTKTRRAIIKETMPSKLNLKIVAYWTHGHGGGNNPNQVESRPISEYEISDADIEQWVEAIRNRLQ